MYNNTYSTRNPPVIVKAILFSCQATRLGFTAIPKVLLTVNVTTLPIRDPLIISSIEWSW
jgi:hypothetical protein